MADETKPQDLPAKRKLALTEDEHALIESYRQRNLAVDSYNAGITKAMQIVSEYSPRETPIQVLERLERQRKLRVSVL